ncbi:HAMP domain-containing sensor histidine kinase [Clostridium intestinale]|uniref:sensor histidine kinase n=1 Tax=Clostridium intestinale TaxID=36845 RepID=UPI002DD63385|nr:HAMP domain-containing sensor histidine kinase [Clostridium intestinale]WRY52951.1 HAMP domain-containing sensor histidine kinase [Clostridium intestinale]
MDNIVETSYIIENNGILEYISEDFLCLSDFSREDLISKKILDVWDNKLKINIKLETLGEVQEAFLFTKNLEVRFVVITRAKDKLTDGTKYSISEIPESRFEHNNMYLEEIYKSNISGIAVYSIPNMILIKANEKYLDYLEEPFNNKYISFGKKIEYINTGWKGSQLEKTFKEIIDTKKTVQIKEYLHKCFHKDATYCDLIITPLCASGELKYLVINTFDVTTRALNRLKISEQLNTIKLKNLELIKKEEELNLKNETLNSILDNIYDCLAVIDGNGRYLSLSKTLRDYIYSTTNKDLTYIGETLDNGSEYYDIHGNLLSKEDLPVSKVIKGITVKNQIVLVKKDDKNSYLNFTAIPIYKDKDNIKFCILVCSDVTKTFEYEVQLNIKNKTLLKAEKEKNLILEQSMKIKDDFLYFITHEFKTPMSVINLAIQAIESICKNDLTLRINNYLKVIKQNTNRQLRLVNNLLEVTRINSGYIKIHEDTFDIVYVLNSLVNSIQLYAKQKNIHLIFISHISSKNVLLDEEKLERILFNLLSNALKFTPEGKSITVNLSSEVISKEELLVIEVKDEGIGIPKEKQKVIFERFGQVDSSLSSQAEGTGLGLYLVCLLVKALNGNLKLESELGKGSTFTIKLPINSSVPKENFNDSFVSSDSRIIQATEIEFSDIYF